MNKPLSKADVIRIVQKTLIDLDVVHRDCNGVIQGDCNMCPGGGGETTNILGWNPVTDTLTSKVNGISASTVITVDTPATTETYEAGQNLSTGRVVVINAGKAFYFQPTNPAHHNRAAGVTRTSATTGNDVLIQPYGVVSDAAFTFAPDIPLWVGPNGEVQNSFLETWRVVQKAGVSYENDKMLIDFSTSVLTN